MADKKKIGSKEEVFLGKAHQTIGGLVRKQLQYYSETDKVVATKSWRNAMALAVHNKSTTLEGLKKLADDCLFDYKEYRSGYISIGENPIQDKLDRLAKKEKKLCSSWRRTESLSPAGRLTDEAKAQRKLEREAAKKAKKAKAKKSKKPKSKTAASVSGSEHSSHRRGSQSSVSSQASSTSSKQSSVSSKLSMRKKKPTKSVERVMREIRQRQLGSRYSFKTASTSSSRSSKASSRALRTIRRVPSASIRLTRLAKNIRAKAASTTGSTTQRKSPPRAKVATPPRAKAASPPRAKAAGPPNAKKPKAKAAAVASTRVTRSQKK